MADGPVVSVEINEKRFAGSAEAVFKDFALSAEDGEVVALIGPSGVGKTSLLRMIGGVDRDFKGFIAVDGVPAANAPPPGFVFQDARLLPWLDAASNITAVGAGIQADEVRHLLRLVQLDGYEHAFPHQMSGGMQRRLGLARALSVNPRLLLLDEPFVSLDRQIVGELQTLFTRVFEAGKPTAIIVSHDPNDAAQLADRAVVLSGRPARVVAEMSFDIPRAERGLVDVARLIEQIEAVQRGGPT